MEDGWCMAVVYLFNGWRFFYGYDIGNRIISDNLQ